jgi:polyphenol oxidase
MVFKWSKVSDGNMSVKYGDKETVFRNRKKFLGGIDPVILSLSGGTEIAEITKKDTGKMIEADAAITNETGVGLFMVVGDCFPVAIFDPVKNKLALVHLGYSGIVGGLATKVLERFDKYNVVIKIGPGARKESYKFLVEEVKQKGLDGWKEFLEDDDGMVKIDLVGFLKKQLTDAGVVPDHIDDCGINTITDTNYFSHYRAKRNGESEARFGVVAIMEE